MIGKSTETVIDKGENVISNEADDDVLKSMINMGVNMIGKGTKR